MYKLILCFKYLQTRFLAFVCIVSVMLGVATLIVVNSVMSGFGKQLMDRIHGISSDLQVETDSAEGFDESADAIMKRIQNSEAGPSIVAMAPTNEAFAMLSFSVRDKTGKEIPITKHIRVIGVDPVAQAKVGGFGEYLVRQKGVEYPSFDLDPVAREQFERNRQAERHQNLFGGQMPQAGTALPAATPPGFLQPPPFKPENPLAMPPMLPPPVVDAGPPPMLAGAVVGHMISHFRYTDAATGEAREIEVLRPGDDIQIMTIGASGEKPVSSRFVVVDFFKSGMSEYDNSYVYVPLDALQKMRGMDGRCTTIQIKLTAEAAHPITSKTIVAPQIQKIFDARITRVQTWQDRQAVLLSAIDVERGLLNFLLFMIVGVAGFSILAIFTMIVTEKFRDIGIMKALGASSRGVMSIFLGYGLLLGLIGCIFGTILGVTLTNNINPIEKFLTEMTGTALFPRNIYYFDAIPTYIESLHLVIVNVGAIGTAVLFSVLPALRAARLHPVRALRFE